MCCHKRVLTCACLVADPAIREWPRHRWFTRGAGASTFTGSLLGRARLYAAEPGLRWRKALRKEEADACRGKRCVEELFPLCPRGRIGVTARGRAQALGGFAAYAEEEGLLGGSSRRNFGASFNRKLRLCSRAAGVGSGGAGGRGCPERWRRPFPS